RAPVGDTDDALGVGLLLREQQRRLPIAVEVALSQFGIRRLDDASPRSARKLLKDWPVRAGVPGPLVAIPQRRQDMQLRWLRAAIVDGAQHQHIFAQLLC